MLFGAANESAYYSDFTVKCFRIYLCLMPLATLNKGTFIYLQALGKAFTSTAVSMTREIVFGVSLPIILPIFFGPELGVKSSSAQLTELYKPEDLMGKQLICCVNLEPMHIGSVKSEVRILGTDQSRALCCSAPWNPLKTATRCFEASG